MHIAAMSYSPYFDIYPKSQNQVSGLFDKCGSQCLIGPMDQVGSKAAGIHIETMNMSTIAPILILFVIARYLRDEAVDKPDCQGVFWS